MTEPEGMRARNYQSMVARYVQQFKDWEKTDPTYRHKPFRDSTMMTPRMCDMDYGDRLRWAERISAVDAERSINMTTHDP